MDPFGKLVHRAKSSWVQSVCSWLQSMCSLFVGHLVKERKAHMLQEQRSLEQQVYFEHNCPGLWRNLQTAAHTSRSELLSLALAHCLSLTLFLFLAWPHCLTDKCYTEAMSQTVVGVAKCVLRHWSDAWSYRARNLLLTHLCEKYSG